MFHINEKPLCGTSSVVILLHKIYYIHDTLIIIINIYIYIVFAENGFTNHLYVRRIASITRFASPGQPHETLGEIPSLPLLPIADDTTPPRWWTRSHFI